MTKANTLGLGLHSELAAQRFQISEAQKKIATASAPPLVTAAPPLPKRHALAFVPKMPGVSKQMHKAENTPGTRRKLVLQVKVKSPMLRRGIGLKV